MILICTISGIILYLLIAAATYGYGQYHWPEQIATRYAGYGQHENYDQHAAKRNLAAYFWPIYWLILWPLFKTKNNTFSYFEKKSAAKIIANNKHIAEYKATRKQLLESNKELELAEAELEKEIAKTL